MIVKVNEEGTKIFEIGTVGANGHICDLEGEVRGLSGQAKAEPNEPVCRIDFQRTKRGIAVRVKANDDCLMYCGARAGFEGEYLIPPKGCSSEDRKGRKEAFLSSYRDRQYASALKSLSLMYRQCKEFLHWIEADEVRNDLSITQLRLGNKTACLAAMKENIASAHPTEEALKERLPPIEFDSYLPVAQATWFNTKKCGGK